MAAALAQQVLHGHLNQAMVNADPDMDTIFTYLGHAGIASQQKRHRIIGEIMRNFEAIRVLDPSRARDSMIHWAKVRPAAHATNMSTNELEAALQVIYYIQDLLRTNVDIHANLYDEDEVAQSRIRAIVRKQMMGRTPEDNVPQYSDKINIDDWWNQVHIRLQGEHGQNGVFLAYVGRESEEPDPNGIEIDDFDERAMACCTIDPQDPFYVADRRRVYNTLAPKIINTPAEQFLPANHAIRQDGRALLLTLRERATNIQSPQWHMNLANQMKSKIHYKSESAFPWSRVTDKMRQMFNHFEQGLQPMNEPAKIDFLIKVIEKSPLKALHATLIVNRRRGTTYHDLCNTITSYISSVEQPRTRLAQAIDARSRRSGRGGGRGGGRSNYRGNGGRGQGGRGRGGRGGRGRGGPPRPVGTSFQTWWNSNYTGYCPPEIYNTWSQEERTRYQNRRPNSGNANRNGTDDRSTVSALTNVDVDGIATAVANRMAEVSSRITDESTHGDSQANRLAGATRGRAAARDNRLSQA